MHVIQCPHTLLPPIFMSEFPRVSETYQNSEGAVSIRIHRVPLHWTSHWLVHWKVYSDELTQMCGSDWSRGIWVTTRNTLIIVVLQFHKQNTFIMMQNVCLCLKGECSSKQSTIFVVLVTWYKFDLIDQSASRITLLWDYYSARAIPRILLWPWHGIPHPKWTWKALNKHKCGFIFNK